MAFGLLVEPEEKKSAPASLGFTEAAIASINSRGSLLPRAMKASQDSMAPLVGAATGAAVNLAFLEHFRGIASAHFTVRRLERAHGALAVRAAYEAIRDR